MPTNDLVTKWRLEVTACGRHPKITPDADQHVDEGVTQQLQGLDVNPLTVSQLRELTKLLGVPSGGNRADLLQRLDPIMRSINGSCDEIDDHDPN